ncbi:hypothetical protein [Streptomyces sp. NRRL WC-3742]|uniref:hypothetical protein n=1 Tax=Streptomyces sp. NRRL WC-3742 TaxID=1463934 RepID=UPI000691B940|nr:hypothetical protein [Streptomyces sp. NRRL WC-3742]
MTDKSVPPNGDDGGSAETPTERLLREAMNARTSLITAHDLRPAAPPKSRIRRLRPVYMVTVPLLGLAAAAAIGVVTLKGSPVADHRTPPPAATTSASPTPVPSTSPTVTPTPTSTQTATETPAGSPETAVPEADPTPAGTAYTFRGVKLSIPAGWRAAPTDPANFHLCLLSPGAPKNATERDCQPYGVDLAVFDAESGIWPTTGDLDDLGGWGHQPYCPVWGNPHSVVGGELDYGSAPVKSTPTVSGRAARKSQWQASCGGVTFKSQLWALPKDQVFVSAVGLKADYQEDLQSIVDSLDVSGHPAPYSNTVSVTLTGLRPGQQVTNDGTPVEFTATFKNTGTKKVTGARAVVSIRNYPGSPPGRLPKGTVDFQDGTTWKSVNALGAFSGTDLNVNAPVDLAPGQSVTISYRLKLAPEDGAGTLPVNVTLVVPAPDSGSYTVPGDTLVNVQVVTK